MIGREQEIALLLERWQRACEGEGHVVVLSGEPGVGKSRIVLALEEQLAQTAHAVLRYQCLPYYCNSPLQPVIEELERTAGIGRDDDQTARLEKLEAHLQELDPAGSMTQLLAGLLAIPIEDRGRRSRSGPSGARPRPWMRSCSGLRAWPHDGRCWSCSRTRTGSIPRRRELLERVVDGTRDAPVLVLITLRPEGLPISFGQANVTALTHEPAERSSDRDADRRADRRPDAARRTGRADRRQD